MSQDETKAGSELSEQLGPVPIRLGRGEIEVGEGHLEGVPALIFGKHGTGVIGGATLPDRYMAKGEALAVITFDNIESLEVVQAQLNKLREKFT